MHRILIAVLAVWWVSAAGHAIPASVMEPYRAYMAAIETDDLTSATAHAEAAYQAGVAAQIDADTLAALAENRAQIYTDTGDHRRAASAWGDLAGVLERAGADADTRARALVSAGLMHLSADDAAAAQLVSDTVIGLYAPGTSSELLYLALRTKANAQWQRGRIRDSSRTAREALAVREALGPVTDRAAMMTAMFAAVDPLMRGNNLDGAFYVSLAADIADATEASYEDRMMLAGWTSHLRERLTEEQRERLFDRTADSRLFDFEVARRTRTGDVDDPEFEGREVVDARPVHREPPEYPRRMAERGLEGFALIMFDVAEDGSIDNVRTLMSVPHPEFGEVSQRAMRLWRYEPRTVDGEPARREGIVTQFHFALRSGR